MGLLNTYRLSLEASKSYRFHGSGMYLTIKPSFSSTEVSVKVCR